MKITKSQLKRIIKEELGGGLRHYESYVDVATKARAGTARVKELINLAATDPKIRHKLFKYMDGTDRMKVRALRKKLGLFQRSIQGPEDLPKGRAELRAIQDIEQDAGRVSATQRGAQEAGEERAYGTTTSDAPIKRSVHDPRQEQELERIKVGTAPLGLMPGFGVATSTAARAAPSIARAIATKGAKTVAKKAAQGISKQALSKGIGIPTSGKSLARKVIKKSIDPEFHKKVKDTVAQTRSKRRSYREPIPTSATAAVGGAFKGHRMMEESERKITKSQLKRIIKEESESILSEYRGPERDRRGREVAAASGYPQSKADLERQRKETKKEMEKLAMERGKDPKYIKLLDGCKELSQNWRPKTSEGVLYKKQLDELLTKIEGV